MKHTILIHAAKVVSNWKSLSRDAIVRLFCLELQ